MPTPEELEQARQQIAAALPPEETENMRAGRELAEEHATAFVEEVPKDKERMVQYTMAYFKALKENIDAGIMAL